MRSQDWDAKFAAKEFLFTDQPNVTVAAEVAGLPAGRALDLAAGQGRNAVWLAQQGWQVTAVDFSPVALGRAEQLAHARGVEVSFVLADLVTWAPPAASFDLVVIAYLQLPVDELHLVLGRAAAAVAPGGTLLIVGHDRDNLSKGVGGPSDPAVLYTVDRLTGALPALRIDKAEQVERTVGNGHGSGAGHAVAIDTIVRATSPLT